MTAVVTSMALAALAACGDDSTASSSSSTPSDSSAASASSAPSASSSAAASTLPAPTGEPIELAIIAQERGPAALPDSRLAAEAAVRYVNTELGGAAGRPLQLESCVTDGSPEQSSACANQLLEKHPVAFVGESELGTAGSVPIIEKAGVPLVGAAGITPELVVSTHAFAFGLDAVADWSGWTKYLATDGNAKKINLINIDIPAAPVFEAAVRSVAEANGATLGKVVSLPLNATDVTSQMAAAAEGDPDVIMAVTSAQLCVPAAQAHESVAPKPKLFLPGICSSPETLAAAGSSMEGALIGVGQLNPYDTSDPEVATYRRVLDTYGDHVPLSQFAGNAFTAVMNLKAVVDDLGPENVTAESITSAFRAASNAASFMTDTSTCDMTVPISPITCVRGRRVLEVKDGALSDLSDKWYDGTTEVKLG
ncbi:MAG TPA: ABC transporter substrate-binding protein [Acidimicrobiales bacterium]|nr:ABC transporter substrate-binding protein [Acidimicrobiales bacterium]